MKIGKIEIEWDHGSSSYAATYWGWTIVVDGFVLVAWEPNLFRALWRSVREWMDILRERRLAARAEAKRQAWYDNWES